MEVAKARGILSTRAESGQNLFIRQNGHRERDGKKTESEKGTEGRKRERNSREPGGSCLSLRAIRSAEGS